MRTSSLLVIFLCLASPVAMSAEQKLRVIDTAPNDVLNIRELPTTGSRIVGVIPPDSRNVIFLGDRQGQWVFVRYKRVEGWVSSRFVVPVSPPIRRGRNLDDEDGD